MRKAVKDIECSITDNCICFSKCTECGEESSPVFMCSCEYKPVMSEEDVAVMNLPEDAFNSIKENKNGGE